MSVCVARTFSAAPIMRSPLSGVTNEAWTKFVRVLEVQPLSAVSESNTIGMFAHRPRRLVDIGIMEKPRHFRAPNERMVCAAEFVPPMTDILFLKSPLAQYEALVASMVGYAKEYEKVPDGFSFAGMLAILHRAGPPGLRGKMFDETKALFERAKDLF